MILLINIIICTIVSSSCVCYCSTVWLNGPLHCLSRWSPQVDSALPRLSVVDHRGCVYYSGVLKRLWKSAKVIIASVKSFSDCFSSPHGHHSRKQITQGNTKSPRPICYSIAKGRKTWKRVGMCSFLFQCR